MIPKPKWIPQAVVPLPGCQAPDTPPPLPPEVLVTLVKVNERDNEATHPAPGARTHTTSGGVLLPQLQSQGLNAGGSRDIVGGCPRG